MGGDFAIQRRNMVDSQLRPSDIADRRIVRAMEAMPRELFAPDDLQGVAYQDGPLKVASGARALLAPRVLAKLLDAAMIGPDDAVLDVGCATGYSAAILANVAKSVVALECDEALAAQARSNLANLGFGAVRVVTGELQAGLAANGPYGVIVVEGRVSSVPSTLLEQLADGGRLAAIEGDAAAARAVLWRRSGAAFSKSVAFDAAAAPLPGFEARNGFVF